MYRLTQFLKLLPSSIHLPLPCAGQLWSPQMEKLGPGLRAVGSDAWRSSLPLPTTGLPTSMRNGVPDPTGRATVSEEPRVLLEHAFLLSDPWHRPSWH